MIYTFCTFCFGVRKVNYSMMPTFEDRSRCRPGSWTAGRRSCRSRPGRRCRPRRCPPVHRRTFFSIASFKIGHGDRKGSMIIFVCIMYLTIGVCCQIFMGYSDNNAGYNWLLIYIKTKYVRGIVIDPDPDSQKKLRNVLFLSAECSLLKARGFSCSVAWTSFVEFQG